VKKLGQALKDFHKALDYNGSRIQEVV